MSCSVVVAAKQSQKKSDTTAHLSPAVHFLDEGQRAFAVAEDRSPSRLEDASECLGFTRSIEHSRFEVEVERLKDAFEQVWLSDSYESGWEQESLHFQFYQQSQQ